MLNGAAGAVVVDHLLVPRWGHNNVQALADRVHELAETL
jgi:hypothetical protein